MASGVTITFTMHLKPDFIAPFNANIATMLEDTKRFKGFRDIRVVSHKDSRARIVMIETWESEQDYLAYIAWRTERGDLAASAGMMAEPSRIDIWPDLIAYAHKDAQQDSP